MTLSVQIDRWKVVIAFAIVVGYLLFPYNTSHISMRLWKLILWAISDGNFFYGYVPMIGCLILIGSSFFRANARWFLIVLLALLCMLLPVLIDSLR